MPTSGSGSLVNALPAQANKAGPDRQGSPDLRRAPACERASMRKGRRENPPPLRPPGLGGGDDAETTRFLNKRGTGDWPVPPRVALPTGATNVGNTTQLDPDGDGPCGPSPRFVPLAGATVASDTHHLFRRRRPGSRRSASPAPTSPASKPCACRPSSPRSWRGSRRRGRSRSCRRRRGSRRRS
jgi:hypothetical protein